MTAYTAGLFLIQLNIQRGYLKQKTPHNKWRFLSFNEGNYQFPFLSTTSACELRILSGSGNFHTGVAVAASSA